MTSYLDQDAFPRVSPSDYIPPHVVWVAGSKNWDVYALSMIIFEWHMRNVGAVKGNGK